MPCEHYKDALIEAVSSAAVPEGELRAHLAECSTCRETYSQEQSLFAAIDARLHSVANTDVPPSLLPRVRAGLETMPVAPSRWTPGWLALAGASFLAAALLIAVVMRQNRVGGLPVHSVANPAVVPETVPSKQSALPLAPSPQRNTIPQPSMRGASAPVPREHAAAPSFPEVLVPRDQEVLLAGYTQEWSSRKRPPLIAKDTKDETAVALLEVAPIQITELDVKLLAEGDSQ